eukprot:COSAG02_NODE_56563_length_285_cov_0.548387_1_plen_21_part_01
MYLPAHLLRYMVMLDHPFACT